MEKVLMTQQLFQTNFIIYMIYYKRKHEMLIN